MIKPRTPPGVMELLPRDQIAFQRMLDVIRRNYERFGFLPVETPVFELSDVLLTKSGGETERQVYFVQSTGALANAAAAADEGAESGGLPELALLDMGDFAGAVLKYVSRHPVERLTICGGFAKLTKLAARHLDLHSHRTQVDLSHLAGLAIEAGAGEALATAISSLLDDPEERRRRSERLSAAFQERQYTTAAYWRRVTEALAELPSRVRGA